jgi:hypothetical protein
MLPHSAAQKLRRADQHISDLNSLISAYFNQRPFKVVKRFNADTGNLSLSIKCEIPIPDQIPIILGDAIHNLRAVLDHAYFSIITRNTSRRDNIQFPIYRPDNKKDVLGRRLVKLAGEKVCEAIEYCQPEPGGRYLIYELDAIDVEDKHRAILIAARSGYIPAALLSVVLPEIGVQFTGPGIFRFTGDGDDVFSVAMPPIHPITKHGTFENEVKVATRFDLIFGEGNPFASREIIPTINELRQNVATAAETICKAAL